MVCMCSLFRHGRRGDAAFKTLGSRKHFSPYIDDAAAAGRAAVAYTDPWGFPFEALTRTSNLRLVLH